LTIIRNTIKNYNAIPKKTIDEEGGSKKYEFKKILLAVTVMHSVVSKKE
jgi:hypothetical protein